MLQHMRGDVPLVAILLLTLLGNTGRTPLGDTALATSLAANTPAATAGAGPRVASAPSPAASPTPLPLPACGLAWRTVASANPVTGTNGLGGVVALTPNNLWAVGDSEAQNAGYTEPLIEHWDGQAWTSVSTPLVNNGSLGAISAVSASDLWAVGNANNAALAEHWDGAAWTIVPTPNGSQPHAELAGVATVGPADAWAVGVSDETLAPPATFVVHWDGVRWTSVPSPNPGRSGNALHAVAAVAANDVWAVGALTNADGTQHTLVEHWNGQTWSVVPSASPGVADMLVGVVALSPMAVWAAGTTGDGRGTSGTLIERWDGATWTVVPSPNPYRDFDGLRAIAAGSGTDLWVTGYGNDGTADLPLAEHWDGGQWTVVPNAGASGSNLLGLAVAGPGDVWAVGFYFAGAGIIPSLVKRYSDPCAPPPPTATPAGGPGCLFRDVCPADYFYPAVAYLVAHGTLSGYADGTFRPYNTTTRGQLAKIVVGAEGWPFVMAGGPHFADVPPADPFYPYIETGYAHGVIAGYADGTFRPAAAVTRAQVAKIVVTAQGWPLVAPARPHFTDVPPANPFYAVVETAVAHGILSGYADGTFRPGANATRGQISKIVYGAVTGH